MTSTDGRRQPPFEGGLTGGLVEIGGKLSDLKQSVRVEIRWLPTIHHFQAYWRFPRHTSLRFVRQAQNDKARRVQQLARLRPEF